MPHLNYKRDSTVREQKHYRTKYAAKYDIELQYNRIRISLQTGKINMGGGVRPASQNPYLIYDQNLWYSLPYWRPDQKFETLFMTWLSNQNPVSHQRYNKFPSSDQC